MKNPAIHLLFIICFYFHIMPTKGQLNPDLGVRINEYRGQGLSDKSGLKADANFQGFKAVLWLDNRNVYDMLFGQIMDENNQLIGSNFQISEDLEEVRFGQYDVEVSNDKKTLIAWAPDQEVIHKRDVYYQIFDASGAKIFDKKMVPPKNERQSRRTFPAVAFLDDGSFVIAMFTYDIETFKDVVFIQKFDSQGTPLTNQVVLYEYDGYPRSVDVSANSNRIVVVFERDAFRETSDVYYVSLDSSLNIITPPTLIQNAMDEDQFNPQIDKFSDQSFIASWFDKSEKPLGEVKVQRFNNEGMKTGPSKSLGESKQSLFSEHPFIETKGNEFMLPISTSQNTWKIYNQSFNQIATGDYEGTKGSPCIDRYGFGILYVDELHPPLPSIRFKGVDNTSVDIEVNDDSFSSDQTPLDIVVNDNGEGVISFTDREYINNYIGFQLVNSKKELIGTNRIINISGEAFTGNLDMANDGSFALIWKELGNIPPYYVKGYIQFFDKSGIAITDTTRLYYNPGGTVSGIAHALVYNTTFNRYLALSEPRKNGKTFFNIAIFDKTGQLIKPQFDLLEIISPFTKAEAEVTSAGEFIISYHAYLKGDPSGERSYYYTRLSGNGEVLEKNKKVIPEINSVENHYLLQIDKTTYFIWRSSQDSVGPDKINQPIMIRGLSDQGSFGNISYLDVPGKLFSVLKHQNGIKIFTEENDEILLTNFEVGSTHYKTISFVTPQDYPLDNFKWVTSGDNMYVAYKAFVEKGRGLDVVYDVLLDEDQDGFFEQTDCNDTVSTVNPLAMEIPNNDIDENCDGIIEREDQDNDGYVVGEDCNDMDSLVNPGQDEIPYNGKNDDCDSTTLDDDLDGDGFLLANDCNDMDPNINPDAVEIPNNGIDEDCDGMDSTTSVQNSLDQTQIIIFPIPASDQIQIYNRTEIKFDIQLFDLSGKTLPIDPQNGSIDLSAIPNGMYLLIMKNNKDQLLYRKKIIVHHEN